jgi:hypothetical protein
VTEPHYLPFKQTTTAIKFDKNSRLGLWFGSLKGVRLKLNQIIKNVNVDDTNIQSSIFLEIWGCIHNASSSS